jgi:aldose 1-epimerase
MIAAPLWICKEIRPKSIILAGHFLPAQLRYMFDIQSGEFGRFHLYSLINTQSGEYTSIIPEFGANVAELVLRSKDILVPVLKGYDDGEALQTLKGYRNCRLIPYPNRVRHGRYSFRGRDYQLPINREKEGNAIHGFFFDRHFEVDKCTAGPHEARLDLHASYKGGVVGYPFSFSLSLAFVLDEGGFRSEIGMTNTGDTAMPVGEGWHPYFTFSGKDASIDHLQFKLPPVMRLELDVDKVPTGRLLPFNRFDQRNTIGDLQLDTGLKLEAEGKVVSELYDVRTEALLGIWQEAGPNGYNYLQVYTPPDRSAIAIEPMTCAPDAFNNGMGLIELEPGKSFTARMGVYLQ